MNEVGKILVTTDLSGESREAFGLARQMAENLGGRITVLHVTDPEVPPSVVEYAGLDLEQIQAQYDAQAKEKLIEIAASLGSDSETALVSGKPHEEIVRFAVEKGVDLIVMATHGRGFFSHAILGSTTERVVRNARCPVLVARTTPATK